MNPYFMKSGGIRIRVLFFVALAVFITTAAALVFLFVRQNSYVTPMVGGTYREGLVGTLTTINPLLSALNPVEEDVTTLIFSGLTKYDIKQKKIVPDLATFQSNSTYTEFTFFLNPKATWHDGTPLTADDVVFTYNLIADEKFPNAYVHSIFANVKVAKVDQATVKFTLPNSYQFFPTATTIGILPQHIWKDVTPETLRESTETLPIVGSGPYKIAEDMPTAKTQTSQTVQLERNPNYFGEIPYLETLSLQFYSTVDELMDKKNALVGIRNVPNDYIPEVEAQQRFELIPIATSKYTALFFNTEKPALKAKKLRLGLSLALDRIALIGDKKFVTSITSPFLNNDANAWQNAYDLEKAKGSLYDSGYRFATADQITQKKKDIVWDTMSGTLMAASNAANANVNSAGNATNTNALVVNSNQNALAVNGNQNITSNVANANQNTASDAANQTPVRPEIKLEEIDFDNLTVKGVRATDIMEEYTKYRINSTGQKLTLRVVTLDAPAILPETGAAVVAGWKELGVDAVLDIKTSKDMVDVIRTRAYDVLLIGQELGYDLDLFPFWHSSNARLTGRNLSNYKNSALDALIDSIRSQKKLESEEAMEEALQKNIAQIEKIFVDDMPAIFLWRQTDYFAIDKKIKNVYIQNLVQPKDRFSTISSWYEKEGKNPKGQLTIGNFAEWLGSRLQ